MDQPALETILERLEAIESRLDRLEATQPVGSAPPQKLEKERDPGPLTRALMEELSEFTPAPTTDETEYFVGAKVLPRAGAAILMLMFAYFVSIAYDRGWIGPPMIFGGAAALCLLLIGLGQWKRNEREEFGQILTGIGSCGLFLDFAGGHVFQKLYSGETMVGLFVALSVANLAYSLWRASKPFLGIGVAGGFTAALMPLSQHRAETSLSLLFAIFVPAAYVCVRNRWSGAALTLWTSAALTALPIGQYSGAGSTWAAVTVEIVSLVGLLAYLRSCSEDVASGLDPLAAVCIFSTAVAAFSIAGGVDGSTHVMIFAAAAAGIALFSKLRETREVILSGSIASAFVLAPLGLPPVISVFAFLLLAAVSSAGSREFVPRYLFALALTDMLLGIGQYGFESASHRFSLSTDVAFVLVGLPVSMVAGRLFRRAVSEGETAFLFLAVAFFARGTYLGLVHGGMLESNFAITASLLLSSIFALALGFWRDLPSLRQLCFCGFAVTCLKALAVDLASAAPFVRVGLLFALGIGLLLGGYWYIRREAKKAA